MLRHIFMVSLMMVALSSLSHAAEVYLLNGDRVSGQIVSRSAERVVIDTQTMGEVSIKGEFVKSVYGDSDTEEVKENIAKAKSTSETKTKAASEKKAAVKEKVKSWTGKWTVGGFQQGGNTRKRRLNYALKLNKKNPMNEWTFESKSSYASESRTMTEQKHYGMMRYGYQLEEDSQWFFFGKLEADSDRFSNVDYRLVPAYGGGYWFSDTDDLKMVTDGAIGYQYTAYRDNTKNEGEWVWIPRFFMDTKFIANMRLTQEITLYPSLEDVETFRLRSETSLVQPINDKISWKLTLSEEYNSQPKGSAKKNDYSLTAGIDVAF